MKTQSTSNTPPGFVKNLTDSAIELAVRGQSEDYGAVLLKH
jgi:acylphosphatase